MDETINVSNVYQFVSFHHDEERRALYVRWDSTHKVINSLMDNESLTRDEGILCNHVWVDEIKRCSQWTNGNKLYLRTFHFYKGMFCVKYKFISPNVYAYEEIDEDGYLLVRKYDDDKGYFGELIRANCIYNNNLQQV